MDYQILRLIKKHCESEQIKPELYFPVVPTVLLNGVQGFGTGWYTNIPNYNPRDIVENIRRLIRSESQHPMVNFDLI